MNANLEIKNKMALFVAIIAFVTACAAICRADEAAPAQQPPASVERYKKYLDENPNVRNAISWRKNDKTIQFDEWDEKSKNLLYLAIADVEAGNQVPLPSAPKPDFKKLKSQYASLSTDDLNCVSIAEGRKIFFYHLAHSLKAELDHKYPWRLADMSGDNLKLLLGVTDFYEIMPGKTCCFTLQTNWNPEYTANFLEGEKIAGATQEETLFALTRWFSSHLSHYYYHEGELFLDTQERMFGRRWIPDIEQILGGVMNEGQIFYFTMGCGGTARLYREILRSANIPVKIGYSFLDGNPHQRVEFPTMGLGLAHGDDPYTLFVRVSPEIPSREIFFTIDELAHLIDKPENILCSEENGDQKCNTPSEQASWNHDKKILGAMVRHNGFYLALTRASSYPGREDFPKEIDESLTGSPVDRDLVVYGKPFFTPEERKQIIEDTDKRILELGGGDWDTGLAEVLSTDPYTGEKNLPLVEGMLKVAGTYSTKGMNAKAIEVYRKILAGGENTAATLSLSDTLMALGRYAEAIEVLRKAEAGNNAPQIPGVLARAYRGAGRYEEAEKIFEKALASGESGTGTLTEAMMYYRFDAYDLEKAEAAARKFLALENKSLASWARGMLASIIVARDENNAAEALALLEKNFRDEKERFPEAMALASLGRIFMEERYDSARYEEYRKKAIEKSPDCAQCRLAGSYLFEPDRMLEVCGEALKIEPKLSQAQDCIESVYYKKGDYERVAAYSEEFDKTGHGRSHTELEIASFFRTGRREEALRLLDREWQYNYEYLYMDADFNRMRVFAIAGEYELFEAQFDACRKKWPDNPRVFFQAAKDMADAKKYDEALTQIRVAIRLNPNEALYYSTQAMCLSELGRHGEAVESAKKAMELSPKGMPYLLDLGEIYLKQGDKDKAGQAFRDALKIAPGNSRARKGLEGLITNPE